MFNFEKTPYTIEAAAETEILARLRGIEERVMLLRKAGTLTEETVRLYYGEKRFEQVAESNAIEGSTLSVGETALAVAKGITISGHDPAFARDAIALDKALSRVVEMARVGSTATDNLQLLEVHGLLLGDRLGSGSFRRERVKISGSDHQPPKTPEAVLSAMEDWESWSKENPELPAPIRAAVLHAWLTHIHPFLDGNGRTSRAIGNLELIRAGYPPLIIKKKDRERYIQALSDSDGGGDLSSFMELIFERIDNALTGMEHSARKRQGYDVHVARVKAARENNLRVWQTGVGLLVSMLNQRLSEAVETIGGRYRLKSFDNHTDYEDYESILDGRNVAGGWSFIINISIAGLPFYERLAFVQHRTAVMFNHLNKDSGPSVFWSEPNPKGYPKWRPAFDASPYAIELTSKTGSGDDWFARLNDGRVLELRTSELADRLTQALLEQATTPGTAGN